MFYPSCAIGAVGWTMQGQGEPIDVEKYLSLGGGDIVASDEFSVLEDEEDFTRDLPLNMSDDEVKGFLLVLLKKKMSVCLKS